MLLVLAISDLSKLRVIRKVPVLLCLSNCAFSHLRGLKCDLIELSNASCPGSIRGVVLEIHGVKISQTFMPIYIAYKKLRTDILVLHVAPHLFGFRRPVSVYFDHSNWFLGSRGC